NACIFSTFIFAAILKPASSASYSASLFALAKFNRRAWEYSAPSGSIRMRPTPDPCSLEAPSVYSFHMSALVPKFSGVLVFGTSCYSLLFPSVKVSFGPLAFTCVELSSAIVSARKSASTCPFIALLRVYLMP
ncbi:hypothetical protein Tco_1276632, partial [Tanacetum coccineum]